MTKYNEVIGKLRKEIKTEFEGIFEGDPAYPVMYMAMNDMEGMKIKLNEIIKDLDILLEKYNNTLAIWKDQGIDGDDDFEIVPRYKKGKRMVNLEVLKSKNRALYNILLDASLERTARDFVPRVSDVEGYFGKGGADEFLITPENEIIGYELKLKRNKYKMNDVDDDIQMNCGQE